MNDDLAKRLGMTAADAAHDAECEHFAEAASLAAQLQQAWQREDALCDALREIASASSELFLRDIAEDALAEVRGAK